MREFGLSTQCCVMMTCLCDSDVTSAAANGDCACVPRDQMTQPESVAASALKLVPRCPLQCPLFRNSATVAMYGDYSVVKEQALFYWVLANKPSNSDVRPSHTQHTVWSSVGSCRIQEFRRNHQNNSHQLCAVCVAVKLCDNVVSAWNCALRHSFLLEYCVGPTHDRLIDISSVSAGRRAFKWMT